MKTTTEATADLRDALLNLISVVMRPVTRRVSRLANWARRVPHRLRWWASRGVPSIVRNQWRSWRYEIERQRVAELYHAGLYDEYAKAKNELRQRWGV